MSRTPVPPVGYSRRRVGCRLPSFVRYASTLFLYSGAKPFESV